MLHISRRKLRREEDHYGNSMYNSHLLATLYGVKPEDFVAHQTRLHLKGCIESETDETTRQDYSRLLKKFSNE